MTARVQFQLTPNKGPLLNSLPKSDDATPDIYGSAVIWAADSQEEVLDILKKDVYVQKGVWDFEKVSRRRVNWSSSPC